MALVKVQWKKPGEFALLDSKDLNTPCGFMPDGRWKLFMEPEAIKTVAVPAQSDAVIVHKPLAPSEQEVAVEAPASPKQEVSADVEAAVAVKPRKARRGIAKT